MLCLVRSQAQTNLLYSFQGTATGSVGGVPFTNAGFAIRLAANTANVVLLGPGFYSATGSSATIAIAGVGSGTLTTPKRVFAYQPGTAVGFGVAPNGADELDMQSSDFATYDLKSPLDPVLASLPSYLALANDPSTLGPITFTSVTDLAFDAATVAALPGPPLIITRSGASVVLRWPTNTVGYTLQSAAAVSPGATWVAVTNVPIVVGVEKFVTNPVSGGARFYRLIK